MSQNSHALRQDVQVSKNNVSLTRVFYGGDHERQILKVRRLTNLGQLHMSGMLMATHEADLNCNFKPISITAATLTATLEKTSQ